MSVFKRYKQIGEVKTAKGGASGVGSSPDDG